MAVVGQPCRGHVGQVAELLAQSLQKLAQQSTHVTAYSGVANKSQSVLPAAAPVASRVTGSDRRQYPNLPYLQPSLEPTDTAADTP